jgi:hypothetical protein
MAVTVTAYLSDGALVRRRLEGGVCTIGRSPNADLRVPDPRVSRAHCRLVGDREGWRVEDLASKNGILLDGRRVSTAPLDAPAWLSLGGVALRIEPDRADPVRRRKAEAVLKRLRGAEEPPALFEAALKAARELGGCARASLWSARADGAPRLVARSGPAAPPESLTVITCVLVDGRAIVTHDVAGAEALANCRSLAAGGVRAVLCLPLAVDGVANGVLYADSREIGKAFSDLDIALLQGLAEQTAIAIAAVRLREAVKGTSALRQARFSA